MKKLLKKTEYPLHAFDEKRDKYTDHRRYQSDSPIVAELLFSIRHILRLILAMLAFLCGCVIGHLLGLLI